MKKLIIASAFAALAVPAFAQDAAWGGMGGNVSSSAFTGGVAVTGGLAINGNNGVSKVSNEQFAANASWSQGSLSFETVDGVGISTGPGIWGVSLHSLDAINVGLNVESGSNSVQNSKTRVVNNGQGTAGFGGGLAISSGGAEAGGAWGAMGFTGW